MFIIFVLMSYYFNRWFEYIYYLIWKCLIDMKNEGDVLCNIWKLYYIVGWCLIIYSDVMR